MNKKLRNALLAGAAGALLIAFSIAPLRALFNNSSSRSFDFKHVLMEGFTAGLPIECMHGDALTDSKFTITAKHITFESERHISIFALVEDNMYINDKKQEVFFTLDSKKLSTTSKVVYKSSNPFDFRNGREAEIKAHYYYTSPHSWAVPTPIKCDTPVPSPSYPRPQENYNNLEKRSGATGDESINI